jgi:hypothetical protein
VLNRWLLIIVAFAGVAVSNAEVSAAASVEVQLYPLSGEVRLSNPNGTQFGFTLYELTSEAGAFTGVPANWTSIADTYDASGNGFIDPTGQWIELSATPNAVAEGLFVGTTSNLPAYRSIGIGSIWDSELALPHDIEATILDANSQVADLSVVVSLLGDYDRDLKVDALDYVTWRMALGSVSSPNADGNFDGVVDAADYTVWRDNFGLSLAGAGYASVTSPGGGGSASVAPEPAALCLAFFAGASLLGWRTRRSRSV